jgi:threonine synthase
MSFARALRCRECHREYPLQPLYVCEFCFGSLEVAYDYDALARSTSRDKIAQGPLSMWRYRDFLPVEGEVVDINAGFTPLLKAKNLGEALGLKALYIKNDCVNPTYSFKDRVVSLAVSKAREFGFDSVACASTGNLANSVAAHAAKARMKAFIFIPADLEKGKIVGTAIYRPTLVAVEGNYDEVNRLCGELAERYPWAFVNISVRPYYSEGSKTLAYEVAEQLGWRAPDHCVVPAASGSLHTKVWKGLNELSSLGLIGEVRTRMHLTQPLGCAPIVQAFERGDKRVKPVRPQTLAKSLAMGNPADGVYALRVLRESGGGVAAPSDEEIVEGMKLLAETEGIFAETAGGVVIAGLGKLVQAGAIALGETTVAYITGAGPKTVEAVEDKIVQAVTIKPTLASFQQALGATLNEKTPRG